MKKQLQSRTFQFTIAMLFILNSYTSFSQSLDQNHTGTGVNYLSCEQTSVNAQSFTAGLTGLLNEIKADVSAQFCPFNVNLDTIAFVANIYDGNGTTGTLLTSQNVVMNIPYTRYLFPITFSNPALLTAGNQYTIEFRVNFGQICDAPNIAINFIWYTSASNSYPGGQPYSTLFSGATNDFYFQTFMATSSGVEEKTEIIANIYPNPASERLTIQTVNNEKLQIEIYSLLGKKVMSKIISDNETLPVNHLSTGIYYIKIIAENNTFTRKKIQIIK